MIKFLIEQHAKIGRAFLHSAAKEGRLFLVKFFVGHGSDIEISDKNGKIKVSRSETHETRTFSQKLLAPAFMILCP